MPRIVFTPQAIATMIRMAEDGEGARAIAVALGSTPASVRVKCCSLKIPLSHPGLRSQLVSSDGDIKLRRIAFAISQGAFGKLFEAARVHGCSPQVLARWIVTLVLRDDLIDAVIDSDGQENDMKDRVQIDQPKRVSGWTTS